MKRIVSIQDLSCFGKCSQTVALPVLSAMGVECAVLPTVLLSAHTAFPGYVGSELTAAFPAIVRHWQTLDLRFDTVYTGFLGSPAQVEAALSVAQALQTAQTLLFVDPAMADDGELYAGLPAELPEAMRALCRRAGFITPNVTEACLLTGETYRPLHGPEYVRRLLEKLLALGVKTAILTGIHPTKERIGVAVLSERGELKEFDAEYYPAVKHGAGDLFAATCAGALTLGMPAAEAVALAADYVAESIRATVADSDARWYGLSFEATLPALIRRCRAYRADA